MLLSCLTQVMPASVLDTHCLKTAKELILVCVEAEVFSDSYFMNNFIQREYITKHAAKNIISHTSSSFLHCAFIWNVYWVLDKVQW